MPTPLKRLTLGFFFLLCAPELAIAAILQGVVTTVEGRAIPSARVLIRTLRGTERSVTTDAAGRFEIPNLAVAEYRLIVLAPSFRSHAAVLSVTGKGETQVVEIQLHPGGPTDEIIVTSSALDQPLSGSPSSATLMGVQQLDQLQIQGVSDALRYVPGIQLNQTGRKGAVSAVFARGGESDFNLVMIDGIQVNEFGGNYDFGTLPADAVDRIEVIRGPQSALYGSDAISSVIHVITKKGTSYPTLDLLVEGGSFAHRRVAIGTQGMVHGWRLAANASRIDTDGIRDNDDYRNQALSLNVERFLGTRHSLSGQFLGTSHQVGSPGPFGSDPLGFFGGIDKISRNNHDAFHYRVSYRAEVSSRFRHRIDTHLFSADSDFESPFGLSSSEHFRGSVRNQSDWTLSPSSVLSFGFEYERESFTNTFVSDENFKPFRLLRGNYGYFAEATYTPTNRWLVTSGIRLENIRTRDIPGNSAFGRPRIPQRGIWQASPKISARYVVRQNGMDAPWGSTVLRASLGSGMRAAGGFELAFTDNPRIDPERSVGFDLGLQQTFARGRGVAGATYFYNRFRDLIVTLGGATLSLSEFRSDNLANSRGQGMEFDLGIFPSAALSIRGQYSYLATRILALDGSAYLAPAPFQVGQPLLRRPSHSGSLMISWKTGRVSGTFDALARSRVLDVEPNLGAFGGLFYNPGYVVFNTGLEYGFPAGVGVYARLNNLANRKYEESFGFPALPLNFVVGLKWHVPLAGR